MQINKEITDDDFNRRAIAAEQLKNAQLVEASKAAREKMAGEFSRVFKDPMGSLKEMGDKAAGEAAAAMVQRAQNHFGGAGASANALGGEGGIFGGLFSRITGAPKSGAAGIGAKAAAAMPGTIATSKLSLGTAQITIGSANIAFGGGAVAGSGVALSGQAQSFTGFAGSSASFGSGTDAASGSAGGSGFSSSGSTLGEAGDAGSTVSAPVGIAGAPGMVPALSNTLGTALGNVQKGYSFGKQAQSIFGNRKDSNGETADVQHDALPGKLNADGSFTSDTGNAGASSKMGRIEGAAQGAMGVYSAYQSNGGVGGALTGAMGGMQLGMELGGPMGAAIGAAAGAIVGAIGFGGREKARVYDLKQVRPRIANDTSSYEQGGMDYLSAYSDMQSMDMEAKRTTNSYGPAAQSYYQDTIKKEIQQAETKFTSMQKAGRSQFTATAAQYDWGGPIDNFGTLGTTPDHGFIHAQRGEVMIEQQAANTHAGALNAINSGATPADMAKYYGGDSGTMPAQTQSSWGGDIHVHAIDPKSGVQWLMANKHVIRSAFNESLSENSGGADA
jgi:hypothetical protein